MILSASFCRVRVSGSAIGSISPNLMIIPDSFLRIMGGRKKYDRRIVLWLLEDIFLWKTLGMHAIIYMYIAMARTSTDFFTDDDIKLPLNLISASGIDSMDWETYMIMFS